GLAYRLPVITGAIRKLINQCWDWLDMRFVESFLSYRSTNPYVCRGFGTVVSDRIIFEKAGSLAHILKCVQMEKDSLFNSFLRFRYGTAKSRRAEFLATG
ncbi:MAG: hypothetical protein V3R92_06460, partial [Dehalococcoidales bacterium]